MQAIILAGGKGTRLRPYTTVFPKPLVPIGDLPILEIIIRQLKYYGFDSVIMAVGHLKELIMAYFGSGSKWNINITYSVEDHSLGTAAPIKLCNPLDDNFLVLNGDLLCNLNFTHFIQRHIASEALATIATYQRKIKIDLGVLTVQGDMIKDYIEKPEYCFTVSMGIYGFNKEILEFIPNNEYFDLPQLIINLIKNNQHIQNYCFDGYWLDIGRPDDYEQAIQDFAKYKSEFLK